MNREEIMRLVDNKGDIIGSYSNFMSKDNTINEQEVKQLIKDNQKKIIYYSGIWNSARESGNFIDCESALDMIDKRVVDIWVYTDIIILRVASNGDLF